MGRPPTTTDNDLAAADGWGGLGWLRVPGVASLPSGRRVLVGTQEGTDVVLELLGGVHVVVGLADAPVATLTLHRARGDDGGMPSGRPGDSAATVAMDVPGGGLVIRDLPTTPASQPRESPVTCPGQFRSRVPGSRVAEYVDALAGLPLDTRPWSVPVAGVRLWRGRVDSAGRALVELLGDDERRWGAEMPVVAKVDLGLTPPA